MISHDIGIDLGTSNILIYIKKKGIVLNEPSIVAVEKSTKNVVAIGHEANKMLGRTPGKIVAIRPIRKGIIADLEITEIMLNEFIKRLKTKNLFTKPNLLICCPSKTTPIERDYLKEIGERLGARKVYIEEEPKMAAIGAGLNIKEPLANMIIDIGGGTTDIAILSLNDIVTSSSIKVAGETFNRDLTQYIKEKYQVLVGELTAEKIKTEFANVYNPDKNATLSIRGRSLITGLPTMLDITQDETKTALSESIAKIIKSIMGVLETAPPELSADIVEKGVVLTGGGSLLTGLLETLEENLKVPVLIAESPLTCVAEGTGTLLEELNAIPKDQ